MTPAELVVWAVGWLAVGFVLGRGGRPRRSGLDRLIVPRPTANRRRL